jgi:hypothetical protein
LRQADTLLNTELGKAAGLASPIRRYTQLLTRAVESAQSGLVTTCQQLSERQEMLCICQKSKRGKQILLEGEHVFSNTEVFKIAKAAKEITANKARKKRKSCSIMVEMPPTKVDMSESDVRVYGSNRIVVASLITSSDKNLKFLAKFSTRPNSPPPALSILLIRHGISSFRRASL